MRIVLNFICPKRKCRHTWDSITDDLVRNEDCPKCGAVNLCPVAIDVPKLEVEQA